MRNESKPSNRLIDVIVIATSLAAVGWVALSPFVYELWRFFHGMIYDYVILGQEG